MLEKVDKEHSTHGNYFFYLATAPDFFGPVVEQLAEVGLMQEENHLAPGHHRESHSDTIIDSARSSTNSLLRVVDEKQIYRIDHYLGKETVQNILAFRFANGIFEPIWNRRYIDHVQISVAETVGVEKRGGYYDTAGALRDMVPNHMMQLISLTAMEPPISFHANAVRDEQGKILHAIQPFSDRKTCSANRARPVRRRDGGRRARPRLPQRSQGRTSGIENRNLRRHEAGDRQLALGGRSLLPPHRQTPAAPQNTQHRHPVPAARRSCSSATRRSRT